MFGGGKEHEVPCHHLLAEYLDAYIEAAGLGGRAKVALFQGAPGRGLERGAADARQRLVHGAAPVRCFSNSSPESRCHPQGLGIMRFPKATRP